MLPISRKMNMKAFLTVVFAIIAAAAATSAPGGPCNSTDSTTTTTATETTSTGQGQGTTAAPQTTAPPAASSSTSQSTSEAATSSATTVATTVATTNTSTQTSIRRRRSTNDTEETNSTQCVLHSQCINNVCFCDVGYTASGDQCVQQVQNQAVPASPMDCFRLLVFLGILLAALKM